MDIQRIETDDGGHYYELADGRRPPGVTDILHATGCVNYAGIPAERLEAAAERGKAVHLACEDLDKGMADWWSDDPGPAGLATGFAGYVTAWTTFKHDNQFLPEWIERPMYSERYHMAGSPDRVGLIHAGTSMQRQAVVEIKVTWDMNPWSHLQTAGYALLLQEDDETLPVHLARIVVLLKPDGSYEPELSKDPSELTTFLAARLCHRWQDRVFRRTRP